MARGMMMSFAQILKLIKLKLLAYSTSSSRWQADRAVIFLVELKE